MNQPFAVVVENANRADSHPFRYANSLVPTQWIHLGILAFLGFVVKATTISTVHFLLRPCLYALASLTGIAANCFQDSPSLRYLGGTFIIRENGQTVRIPAVQGSPSPDHVEYRKDESFAVWDSRGLTVRKGGNSRTTRMPDVSLTPKLFSKDEILANRDLIDLGTRSKGADALSGSRRIGDNVYFLLRWDDKYSEPWLEALVSINLSDAETQPKLLGKFPGLTTSNRKVDDLLFSDERFLRSITHAEDRKWGIATYDLATGKFLLGDKGNGLIHVWRLSSQTALVEQSTDYDTKTLARIDVVNGAQRVLREFQGNATMISPIEPLVIKLETPSGALLQNLDSGAEIPLRTKYAASLSGNVAVVWPKDDPSRAVLYAADRWIKVGKIEEARNSPEPAGRAVRSRSRRGPPVQP